FITHDLGVIAEIAHRVVIMYKGNVVEEGEVQELFRHPQHPYTKGLLACRPALYPRGARLPVVGDFLEGREPGPPPVPSGPPPPAGDMAAQTNDGRPETGPPPVPSGPPPPAGDMAAQ